MQTTTPSPRRDSDLLAGFLTRTELAEQLRVTPRCLELWRCRRIGPPVVKIGRRVFYPVDGVQAWLAAKTEAA